MPDPRDSPAPALDPPAPATEPFGRPPDRDATGNDPAKLREVDPGPLGDDPGEPRGVESW